ncbi:MAG: hypothetical protein ACLPX8_16035 [Bryobacteraceae bacterium]|jgi:hypothetical protein
MKSSHPRARRWVLLLSAAAFLAAGRMPAQQSAPAAPARLFYARDFKGSEPPYFQVALTRDGNTEYREAVDDDLPVRFKLDENAIDAVFGLAEKLGFFNHPLDSPVKVAFMGAKTFRYENGAQKAEVKFNYSQDPNALALQDWFERMGESARYRIDLERAAKYDHLGVFKAVTALEAAMEGNRLVAPAQFLPMLDRVANNESYMHTARVRAAELADAIRAGNK